MMLVLWAVAAVLTAQFGPVFGTPGLPSGGTLPRIVTLAALIAAGGGVFAIAALVLGAAERSDLSQFRRRPAA